MNPRAALLAFLSFAGFIVLTGSFYTLKETETAVITQFGRPVGKPATEAGLHFKTPFIQTVNRIEKRVLEWNGPANEMPTKDKTYVEVEAFARWRIADPGLFFVGLRDERSAQSRLEDIIGSEVRAAVASHELIEIIRSDKGRTLTEDPQKKGAVAATALPLVKRGRLEIEKDILVAAALKIAPLGIELLDVRIKRVNYNAQVLDRIYKRMISERQQIAQRFRSEGEGEAARILGKKDRDLREVESTAYKQVQQVQGEADAEASRIYAEAYNQSPAAAEFYGFLKTLETYRKILGPGTSVIFSTDSDLFRLLKKSQPAP